MTYMDDSCDDESESESDLHDGRFVTPFCAGGRRAHPNQHQSPEKFAKNLPKDVDPRHIVHAYSYKIWKNKHNLIRNWQIQHPSNNKTISC